jgi:hypothetical protein
MTENNNADNPAPNDDPTLNPVTDANMLEDDDDPPLPDLATIVNPDAVTVRADGIAHVQWLLNDLIHRFAAFEGRVNGLETLTNMELSPLPPLSRTSSGDNANSGGNGLHSAHSQRRAHRNAGNGELSRLHSNPNR